MEIFVKESCTDTSKKFTIRVNNTNAKHLAVIVCVCVHNVLVQRYLTMPVKDAGNKEMMIGLAGQGNI